MNHFSDSDYLVQLPQFTALYEMSQANGDVVDLNVLTQYRNNSIPRVHQQQSLLLQRALSSVVASRLHGHLSTGSWPTSPKSIGLLSGEILKQG
jgi:hypothetical protein